MNDSTGTENLLFAAVLEALLRLVSGLALGLLFVDELNRTQQRQIGVECGMQKDNTYVKTLSLYLAVNEGAGETSTVEGEMGSVKMEFVALEGDSVDRRRTGAPWHARGRVGGRSSQRGSMRGSRVQIC